MLKLKLILQVWLDGHNLVEVWEQKLLSKRRDFQRSLHVGWNPYEKTSFVQVCVTKSEETATKVGFTEALSAQSDTHKLHLNSVCN